MAVHFNFSEFFSQDACFIDNKRASFDAKRLFTVHIFHFNDIIFFAENLVGITDKIEGKLVFFPELLMGLKAIPGNAQYDRIFTFEFCSVVPEVLSFSRTTRRIISWVKVQYNVTTPECREFERFIACCQEFAVRGLKAWPGTFK